MTGRRGLTGTVESFAATVRNIVQLGMGGPPFEATAEEKPAQAVTSQASTNPKSTYDNYRLLLKKHAGGGVQGPLSTTTVFGVVRVCSAFSTSQLHLPKDDTFFSLSLSPSLFRA